MKQAQKQWREGAKAGDSRAMREAWMKGANPLEQVGENLDAACWAARHGHVEALQAALDAGCPMDAPLRWAALGGQPACLEELLGRGAGTEGVNGEGETALFLAAGAGHLECVKTLLSHGAQPEAPKSKHSPLAWACFLGREQCAQALVEAGAQIELSLGRTSAACCFLRVRRMPKTVPRCC